MTLTLADWLEARSGIVCVVGAGGKKTTIRRLMEQATGRVATTASVRTTPPPAREVDTRIFDTETALLVQVPRAAATHRRVAYALPGRRSGRVTGPAPATIAELHRLAGFDLTLVKADGARMRGIKAPRADEPALVPGCGTVIHVVSARVIGQPLDEGIAHRVPELGALLDLVPGQIIEPAHIGRLIADPRGGAQGCQGQRFVSLINQVDGDEQHRLARQAAAVAMAGPRPPARVVLASMREAEPVVDVVDAAEPGAD